MKTAYAYARFSSDNQREESIDAQLRAIREYCQQNDIRILREFTDEAQSARTANRPAFQQLFGTIKDRPADFLIVHKLDRFARNRGDAAFYRAKLTEAGMRLISVLERLDDTPESIIMEGIIESMNEYYSANLSRETKKGQKENTLKGIRNGGKPPWGYSVIDRRLTPNGEAKKVRELFRMYAEGKRISEILKEVQPPMRNLRPVISNEVYLGHLIYGGNRCDNAHKPIIDPETWDACQKRLRNTSQNASNKGDYLLSGLCFCGKCGNKIVGISSMNRYYYYYCKTPKCQSWSMEELEGIVIKKLSTMMRPTPKLKDRFYDFVCSRVNTLADENEALKARSEAEKRIDKLIDSLEFAETPEDTKRIMGKVNEIRRKMPPKPKKVEVSRAACDKFVDLFCDIEALSRDQIKYILRKTVTHIIVNGKETILNMEVSRGISISI